MALKFPELEDVSLGNSPLKQVICQVRFAPLLRLAESLPAAFQEALRPNFPAFGVIRAAEVNVQGMAVSVPPNAPPEYVFTSADGKTEAHLGVDFVSLLSLAYSTWGVFNATLNQVFQAFEATYKKPLTTRIGLRYVNDLTQEVTDARSGEELIEYLSPNLSCVLSNEAWTLPSGAILQLSLPNEGERLLLRMGYDSDPKPHVLLDFDYFIEISPPVEKGREELLAEVNRFHRFVYRAFRWSIRNDKIETFMTGRPKR